MERPVFFVEVGNRQKARRFQQGSKAPEQNADIPHMVEPDREDPELEHRLGFLPELDNRILRVIVSKDEPIRVITAFLDHSMKGKL